MDRPVLHENASGFGSLEDVPTYRTGSRRSPLVTLSAWTRGFGRRRIVRRTRGTSRGGGTGRLEGAELRRASDVAVVQATSVGNGNDDAEFGWFDRPSVGSIVVEQEASPARNTPRGGGASAVQRRRRRDPGT